MLVVFFVVPVLVGFLVSGLIGWAVGSAKGNGGSGFWWGLFLGPIGWIITALMTDERKRCPRCKAVLDQTFGRTCRKCGAMLVRKRVVGGGADPVEQWEAQERARKFNEES